MACFTFEHHGMNHFWQLMQEGERGFDSVFSRFPSRWLSGFLVSSRRMRPKGNAAGCHDRERVGAERTGVPMEGAAHWPERSGPGKDTGHSGRGSHAQLVLIYCWALECLRILNMAPPVSYVHVLIVSLCFRALQWLEKLVTKKRWVPSLIPHCGPAGMLKQYLLLHSFFLTSTTVMVILPTSQREARYWTGVFHLSSPRQISCPIPLGGIMKWLLVLIVFGRNISHATWSWKRSNLGSGLASTTQPQGPNPSLQHYLGMT